MAIRESMNGMTPERRRKASPGSVRRRKHSKAFELDFEEDDFAADPSPSSSRNFKYPAITIVMLAVVAIGGWAANRNWPSSRELYSQVVIDVPLLRGDYEFFSNGKGQSPTSLQADGVQLASGQNEIEVIKDGRVKAKSTTQVVQDERPLIRVRIRDGKVIVSKDDKESPAANKDPVKPGKAGKFTGKGLPDHRVSEKLSHQLTIDESYTVTRSGGLEDNLVWCFAHDGKYGLRRNAKGNLQCKYHRNRAGDIVHAFLARFENGEYYRVSNIVKYKVTAAALAKPQLPVDKVPEHLVAKLTSHTLTIDKSYKVTRSGRLGEPVQWVVIANGQVGLQRLASKELSYTYYRNQPGSIVHVYLTSFIDRAYRRVSNIVRYEVRKTTATLHVVPTEVLTKLRQRKARIRFDPTNRTPVEISLYPLELTDSDLDLVSSIKTLRKVSVGHSYDPEVYREQRKMVYASTRATVAGFRKLSQIPALQELEIWRLIIGDDIMKELCNLKSLKTLSFCPPRTVLQGGPTITDAGLQAITGLANLQTLSLGSCRSFTDRGLASVGQLPRLRELNLSATRVSDAGLAELQELKNLETIDLYQTVITDRGIQDIAKFEQLRRINVGRTKFTDVGMSRIANLRELEELWCSSTRVTDKGLQAIKDLRNLTSINLFGTQVTDEGLGYLYGMQKLEMINIYRSRVTRQGADELRRRIPRAKVSDGFRR